MAATQKCPYCGAGWTGRQVSSRHLNSCAKKNALSRNPAKAASTSLMPGMASPSDTPLSASLGQRGAASSGGGAGPMTADWNATHEAFRNKMASRSNLLQTAKGQEELARSENPDDRASIFTRSPRDVLVSADTFTRLATEDPDVKVRQQALGWATNHFAAPDRVGFDTFTQAVAASSHDDLYAVVGGGDWEYQTVQEKVISLDRYNESWQARTARRELVYAVLATSPNPEHRLVAARGSRDTERLKSLTQDSDAEVASAAKMNPYCTRWSAVDVAADRLQGKFEDLIDRIRF